MVRAKDVKADDTFGTIVMLKFKPAVGPLSASDAPGPMLGPGLFLMEGRSVAPEGTAADVQTLRRRTGMSECLARSTEARGGLSLGLPDRRGSQACMRPDTVSVSLSLQAWPEGGLPQATCQDSRTRNAGDPQDREQTAARMPGYPLLQWDH